MRGRDRERERKTERERGGEQDEADIRSKMAAEEGCRLFVYGINEATPREDIQVLKGQLDYFTKFDHMLKQFISLQMDSEEFEIFLGFDRN